MIGMDTNVVVRYLAQDDPKQSEIATRFVENQLSSEHPGFVSLVTLTEIAWVLRECYRTPKDQIARIVEGLLTAKQVVVEEVEVVWRALRAYQDGNADFSDALIGQIGLAAGCEKTVTFDKNAARLLGFELLR